MTASNSWPVANQQYLAATLMVLKSALISRVQTIDASLDLQGITYLPLPEAEQALQAAEAA
ncbi:MAG: hypothetical protein AAFR42_18820, partial [Cyanobacteria bacterium J06628_6]